MADVVVVSAVRRAPVSHREIRRAVDAVLRDAGPGKAAISVVLIGSRRCRILNRRFLGHDYITDVISFPLQGRGEAIDAEIYVNVDRARVQAREWGETWRREVLRLVIHGTLHLTGYDDHTPRGAARMRKAEDRILSRLPERRTT